MNSKKLTVTILLGIVLVAFAFGMYYQRRVQSSQEQKITQQEGRLVRMHSPVLGPQNAPVTIVEFFDPACETCRACVSVRVPVADFRPGRSFRKVMLRNADLVGEMRPAIPTSEQYSTFRAYLDARHRHGGRRAGRPRCGSSTGPGWRR